MKSNNKQSEIKAILTDLKGKYSGSPYDSNNMIKPAFMFFVVDHYLTIEKEILKILPPTTASKPQEQL